MLALAKQEIDGWNMLGFYCKERCQAWQAELEELKRKRDLRCIRNGDSMGSAKNLDEVQQDGDPEYEYPIISA